MFRNLPFVALDRNALIALGRAMQEQPGVAADNPRIPAAYTYLGQFIDHDITFDPTSQLQRFNDPDALVDFRTPRYDLDSLYGRGPADSPYLFEWADLEFRGVKLLAGRNPDTDRDGTPLTRQDLPCNEQGRALIGDPRNDENIIISQLQLAFIKLHDRVVDRVKNSTGLTGRALLEEAPAAGALALPVDGSARLPTQGLRSRHGRQHPEERGRPRWPDDRPAVLQLGEPALHAGGVLRCGVPLRALDGAPELRSQQHRPGRADLLRQRHAGVVRAPGGAFAGCRKGGPSTGASL
jgi:hypothetical protein